LDTCYGVKLSSSTMIEGRKVPVSMYYAGRGKDGLRTSPKPHNAALMTEALAALLVSKLKITGHHAEVCELFADETCTIHDSLASVKKPRRQPQRRRNRDLAVLFQIGKFALRCRR
jgi:hypothetical protein